MAEIADNDFKVIIRSGILVVYCRNSYVQQVNEALGGSISLGQMNMEETGFKSSKCRKCTWKKLVLGNNKKVFFLLFCF